MMDLEVKNALNSLRCDLIKAVRLWQCNDSGKALRLIDAMCGKLRKFTDKVDQETELNCANPSLKRSNRLLPEFSIEVSIIKTQSWFLRLKCLTDLNYIDESFILDEDDINNGLEQIRNVTSSSRLITCPKGTAGTTINHRGLTSSGHTALVNQSRGKATATGMLTGKITLGSKQSSSYRPLTTGLTATQTAFSRSTESLIKYACQGLMNKPIFDYLYNAQKSSNKYPDFRQCLDYITSTTNSLGPVTRDSLSINEEVPTTATSISCTTDLELMTPFWLMACGKCYFNLNMARKAESYFMMAINRNPWLIDAYLWQIKVYLKLGQPLKVMQLCEQGLKYHRDSSSILMNWLARTYSFVSNFYLANKSSWDVLRGDPIDLEALANAGYFAFYNDQIETAMRCFERIHQLSMVHTAAYNETLDKSSDTTKATNQASVASSSNFMSPQLLNNLALCYFYSGYLHKTIPIFLDAFAYSDSSETTSDIWYNMSFIFLSSGYERLASICLELSLRCNPQNGAANNNLGVLKYRNLINTEIHFKSQLETSNKNTKSSALMRNGTYGTTYNRIDAINNMLEDAETHFSPTGLNDSSFYLNQPESLINMALVQERRGRVLQACKLLSAYLQYNPDNEMAMKMFRDLQALVMFDA